MRKCLTSNGYTNKQTVDMLQEIADMHQAEQPPCEVNGYENLVKYYQEDEAGNIHPVYVYEELCEQMALDNKWSYDEACEYVDYNVCGYGSSSLACPVFIHRLDPEPHLPEEYLYGDEIRVRI